MRPGSALPGQRQDYRRMRSRGVHTGITLSRQALNCSCSSRSLQACCLDVALKIHSQSDNKQTCSCQDTPSGPNPFAWQKQSLEGDCAQHCNMGISWLKKVWWTYLLEPWKDQAACQLPWQLPAYAACAPVPQPATAAFGA